MEIPGSTLKQATASSFYVLINFLFTQTTYHSTLYKPCNWQASLNKPRIKLWSYYPPGLIYVCLALILLILLFLFVFFSLSLFFLFLLISSYFVLLYLRYILHIVFSTITLTSFVTCILYATVLVFFSFLSFFISFASSCTCFRFNWACLYMLTQWLSVSRHQNMQTVSRKAGELPTLLRYETSRDLR